MRPCRFVLFVVLAVLVLPAPCRSQTRILIISRCEPEAARLSAVVERCAAMALAAAGFDPVIAAGTAQGAAAASASLLLELSLKAWGYDLSLSLRGREGELLATGRLGGELGLDLDEAVIVEVAELVAGTGLEPEPLALAEPETSPAPSPQAATEAALPPPSPPSPVLIAAASVPATTAGPEPLPSPAPAGPSEPTAGTAPSWQAPAGKRFNASISTAPFFVVGAAAEFFRFGFDTGAYAGATLLPGPLRLDAGGRLGYAMVFPSGSVGGEVHLLSLGFELRAAVLGKGAWAAFARLGAGPLLVAAVASGSGSQVKLLPFCHAGLGLEIRPSPSLSIGLDLGLLAVLERSLPLVGLTPGLRVAFRP